MHNAGFVLLFGVIMNTRATLFLGLLNNFMESAQFEGESTATVCSSRICVRYSTDKTNVSLFQEEEYITIMSALVPFGVVFAPTIAPLQAHL
eukprot:SAG31_NODE_4385_length_3281_cov_137.482401_4_plen_92_part_00